MNPITARLGDFMGVRKLKGANGLPMFSVTLEHGLVRRDQLDRKMETNLSAEQHLRVFPGDIAYNMMRMWQGASGIAHEEGLVSPAYVVLKPKTNLNSLFAAYLFKSRHMIHRFWSYSYGLTSDRLRLYAQDALRVPVHIPPLPEQQKIAEILSTWDQAIEATQALLDNAKRQKRALMQQLLSGKRRFPEFQGQEWKEVRLGDLGQTFTGLTGKSKEDFGQGAPFLTYMNIFQNSRINPNALSYVNVGENERQNKVEHGDIFFTTSSETPEEVGMAAVLLDDIENCYLNSFCFGFRLNNFNKLTPYYAQFLLRGQSFRRQLRRLAQGATRYNLSKRYLLDVKLQLPSKEEQLAINQTLEAAAQSEASLNQKVGRFRSEKKALMQQLLTGKRRVMVDV